MILMTILTREVMGILVIIILTLNSKTTHSHKKHFGVCTIISVKFEDFSIKPSTSSRLENEIGVVKKMELENGFSPLPDFLIIYNSREMSQGLVLFSDYRKYYPTPLPQSAILKKPEGTFWTVKWKITQEEIITFEDGWTKFVKENGLIDGDFLWFTYDGSRSFWVRIYRNGLIVKSEEAPIKVEVISDDEEEDSQENMIVSLSLGSEDKDGDDDDSDADYDDDNDDDDDDDTTICDFGEAPESSKRGLSTRKGIENPEMYLDNIDNPFFVTTSSSRKMAVAQQVIRDYDLKFGRTVKLIDGVGKVKLIDVPKFNWLLTKNEKTGFETTILCCIST